MVERNNSEARRARLQHRLTETKNRLERARQAQSEGAMEDAIGEIVSAIEYLVDVLDDDLIQ
jgi:hypothetical protein